MKKTTKQSTTIVDKPQFSPHDARKEPRLSAKGGEILSSRSRTVNAFLPTMGERIRRFTRTPQMQDELYNHPDLWDDEIHEAVFNDDGSPISIHETRYQEGLKTAKERKSSRDAEEKQKNIEKEKLEKAAFRAAVRAAIAEGDSTGGEA